jgi:hypothetical protein
VAAGAAAAADAAVVVVGAVATDSFGGCRLIRSTDDRSERSLRFLRFDDASRMRFLLRKTSGRREGFAPFVDRFFEARN